MVKKHWNICKQYEMRAFGPDPTTGLPNRSYFVNKGKHPAKAGEWWKFDGQVEQRTALDQLLEELGDNPDGQASRAQADEAAEGSDRSAASRASAESRTVSQSAAPSLPSVAESPAQQAGERRSQRLANRQKQ